MGFFKRLFGLEKPADAQVNPQPIAEKNPDTGESIPPERIGVSGEYDQSGLAKRVALAFDEDDRLTDLERLYVAQTGSTVVLKGEVPDADTLNYAVEVAQGVNGASTVDADAVTVG